MSIYKKFQTNSKHETEGVILDYGDGTKIRIARAGGANKDYVTALEKLTRKHRRQIQLDVLPSDVSIRLVHELYADTVVLGWEGVTDPEGNPIEFSRENCLKLFQDLPDLFKDILAEANNLALFRAEILEADSKNLLRS